MMAKYKFVKKNVFYLSNLETVHISLCAHEHVVIYHSFQFEDIFRESQ